MECNNTLTHCDLSDLQCGQTYSISVFAVDESCSSAVSDTAYVKTGMVYSSMLSIFLLFYSFAFFSFRPGKKGLIVFL